MITFSITNEDAEKITKWLNEIVYPPILEQQMEDPDLREFVGEDDQGRKIPYSGAIGGGLTFEFSPTSMGTVVKVKHYSGPELDLTDYESW